MKLLPAFLLCLISTPAAGQVPCGSYDAAVDALLSEYNEHRTEGGITSQGRGIVELFKSPDGETWTLLLRLPDGSSCLLGAGQEWGPLPEAGESL